MHVKLREFLYAVGGVVIGAAGVASVRAEGTAPPAYLVALNDVHDMQSYRTDYAPRLAATLAPYGGQVVAAGGRTVPLEGEPPPNSVAILRFPDMDHAHAWYNSPEYGTIKAVRHALATTRSFLVDGTTPGH